MAARWFDPSKTRLEPAARVRLPPRVPVPPRAAPLPIVTGVAPRAPVTRSVPAVTLVDPE